jgi:hypothetical protein
MSDGFTKLFSSIVTSSIWAEDDKTRIIWVTMLALADSDGYVAASIVGLANIARFSIEETKMALEKLMSPDEYSRTKEFEGKRIEVVDGGWLILNYRMYRDRARVESRREYLKNYMREKRKHEVLTGVNSGLTGVNHSASASSSASGIGKEDERKGGLKVPYIGVEIPATLSAVTGFEELFNDFLANRAAKKAKATPKAQSIILDKLAEHPQMAIAGLKEAISRNWTGFDWSWIENTSSGKHKYGPLKHDD